MGSNLTGILGEGYMVMRSDCSEKSASQEMLPEAERGGDRLLLHTYGGTRS